MSAFTSSLPVEQQAIIARQAKKVRPTYFDADIAIAVEQAAISKTDTDLASPDVQISEDLEALLILLPAAQKNALVTFIANSLSVVTDTDESELFEEVQSVRADNYTTYRDDGAAPKQQYSTTKARVMAVVEGLRISSGSTDTVLAELSPLFSSMNDSSDSFAAPEELELHNRITDSLYLADYRNRGSFRQKELLSWISVLRTYP